jgi:hypothetical protein
METMGDPPSGSPPLNDVSPSPILRYTRYYYPLVLFLFFTISLGAWGIATSESSKPTPPPVNGIYENERAPKKKERKKRSGPTLFRRLAARFPGGVQDREESDLKRLGDLRKASMNWLLGGVLATLVANATNVILHTLLDHSWWCGKDYVVRDYPTPL